MISIIFLLFICLIGIALSSIGIMINEKLDGKKCYTSNARRATLGIIIMGFVLGSSAFSFIYCIMNCKEFEVSDKTGQERENLYVGFLFACALAALGLSVIVHMEITKDDNCSGDKGMTLAMIITSSVIAAFCLGYFTMAFIDRRKS